MKSDVSVTVTGGNNSIVMEAGSASQNVNVQSSPQHEPTLPSPASSPSQPKLDGAYNLFVTHDAVNVPHFIQQARRRIVLHAAFYPKYGNDDKFMDLQQAMRRCPDLQLTAIFTAIDDVPWSEEFSRTLRPYFTKDDFREQSMASRKPFMVLLGEFGSRRVHICDTPRLPMFPVLMIDNTLVVGHYAHSSVIPPSGLWLTIQHPGILSMYDSLLAGFTPVCATAEEKAILRYVEELSLCPIH